jgi:ribosomal protein L7/L12
VDFILPMLALFVLILGLMLSGVESKLKRTERKLNGVQRKLDAVLEHLGVRDEVPGLEPVAEFLRQGKTIQAIKAYREATGADLVEAKQAVERMRDQS